MVNKRIMKRARLLKSSRSYSTLELAESLNVHSGTIQGWRKDGMMPVRESLSPYLYMGHEVMRYLLEKQSKHKVVLRAGELYCLKCRAGRLPDPGTLTRRIQARSTMHGVESVRYEGKCPICGCTANRFASERVDLQAPNHVSE